MDESKGIAPIKKYFTLKEKGGGGVVRLLNGG